MIRKIASVAIGAAAALALSAGPAVAHVNDNVPVNETSEDRQGGVPFSGFVGPVEGFVDSDTYVTAHSGMECGALSNPNMTALGPAGINFDDRFVCPAGK